MGDVLDAGFASIRQFQMAHGAQDEVDFLDDVNGQANGARLVHDCPFDALANPPGCVGGKAEATLRLEFFDGVDQAEIAFLDQVGQR